MLLLANFVIYNYCIFKIWSNDVDGGSFFKTFLFGLESEKSSLSLWVAFQMCTRRRRGIYGVDISAAAAAAFFIGVRREIVVSNPELSR